MVELVRPHRVEWGQPYRSTRICVTPMISGDRLDAKAGGFIQMPARWDGGQFLTQEDDTSVPLAVHYPVFIDQVLLAQ